MKQTILTAAPLDGAAGVAVVQRAGRTLRTLASEVLQGSEGTSPEALAAMCSRLVAGRAIDEIILVLPAAWCSCREIGIAPREWGAARAGVLESLEDLVPVPGDDAMVGLLALHAPDESCSRGLIVAARRSLVDPALDALRSAAPGASETVVSSSMAALGLAAESDGVMRVVEPDGVAESSLTLQNGLPVAIDAPSRGEMTLRLGDDVSPAQLAAAAVAASIAAPSSFAPLAGRSPRAWASYLRPAIGVVAALAMLATAPFVWQSRLTGGIDRLRDERAALRASFDDAQSLRGDAERSIALCEAFDQATASWRSSTPALRDAVAALGDDGHLYRLQCDSRGVVLTGEAADPGAVLERLESSPGLTGARPTTPITPSPTDPSLRVFTFTAQVVNR